MSRFLTLLRYGVLLWLLAGVLLALEPGTGSLVGVAAVLAGALLLGLLSAPAAVATTLSGAVLQALDTGSSGHFQRDPDAAGRPRPRAPSRRPAAA